MDIIEVKELERINGIRNGSFNEKGNNRLGDPNNVYVNLKRGQKIQSL